MSENCVTCCGDSASKAVADTDKEEERLERPRRKLRPFGWCQTSPERNKCSKWKGMFWRLLLFFSLVVYKTVEITSSMSHIVIINAWSWVSVSFHRRVQQRVDENRKLGEKLQQVHRVLANETTGKCIDNIWRERSSLCSSVHMPNALLQECLVGRFAASMLVYRFAGEFEEWKSGAGRNYGRSLEGFDPFKRVRQFTIARRNFSKVFSFGGQVWVMDIFGHFTMRGCE